MTCVCMCSISIGESYAKAGGTEVSVGVVLASTAGSVVFTNGLFSGGLPTANAKRGFFCCSFAFAAHMLVFVFVDVAYIPQQYVHTEVHGTLERTYHRCCRLPQCGPRCCPGVCNSFVIVVERRRDTCRQPSSFSLGDFVFFTSQARTHTHHIEVGWM